MGEGIVIRIIDTWNDLNDDEKQKHYDTIKLMVDTFGFTELEIKENVSVYDELFKLSNEEVLDRVGYFLELFGSKEHFLTAMSVGTPTIDPDIMWVNFRGIMSYKRKNIFADKIDALMETLSLSKDEAVGMLVKNYWYMYSSAKVLRARMQEESELFGISTEEYGRFLLEHKKLFPNKKDLERRLNSLMAEYKISREDASRVMYKHPEVIKNPGAFFDNIDPKVMGDLPDEILQKPWRHRLDALVIEYSRCYKYESEENILLFLDFVEREIGRIVKIGYEELNPRIREGFRGKNKIIYTVITAENSFGERYFISLGSGYGTYIPMTPEERLMRAIFGEKPDLMRTEFIVKAPPVNTQEYRDMQWYMFLMCSTGNHIPCVCELNNGKSIVVEALSEELTIALGNGISCSFKTIDVIPTEKKDEYIERHTPVVEKADPDALDEDDYEDPDFDFDDFDYSYEDDETADEGEE